jgi:predicted nuclease with TOPRIM domain
LCLDVDSRISDLKLNNDNTTRALTKFKVEKEELAVRSDVLQLELKRLNDIFHQRHSEVITLKNRQQQLEASIKQRQAEIKLHVFILLNDLI